MVIYMLFQALDYLLEVSLSSSEQSSHSSNCSLIYKEDGRIGRYPIGQFDSVSIINFLA